MKANEYKEMKALQNRFFGHDTGELMQKAAAKVDWYTLRFLGVLHHRVQNIEDELYAAGYTWEEAKKHYRHRNAISRWRHGWREYEFYSEQLKTLRRLHELRRKHENQRELFDMRIGIEPAKPLAGKAKQLNLFNYEK